MKRKSLVLLWIMSLMTYCSSNLSQSLLPGCWCQLARFIFYHGLSESLPLKTIVSKPVKKEARENSAIKGTLVSLWNISMNDQHLVLSEIHSSLISSLRRGRILITSPPRVLTTMLLPTASRTSMVSVFLWSTKQTLKSWFQHWVFKWMSIQNWNLVSHGRAVNAYGFEVRAPTGQRSMTFPESSDMNIFST